MTGAHGWRRSELGGDDMQPHDQPHAKNLEAGPLERAEGGPDKRLRLVCAQELGLPGFVVPAVQPDRTPSSRSDVARPVGLVAEGERDKDHLAAEAGTSG